MGARKAHNFKKWCRKCGKLFQPPQPEEGYINGYARTFKQCRTCPDCRNN